VPRWMQVAADAEEGGVAQHDSEGWPVVELQGRGTEQWRAIVGASPTRAFLRTRGRRQRPRFPQPQQGMTSSCCVGRQRPPRRRWRRVAPWPEELGFGATLGDPTRSRKADDELGLVHGRASALLHSGKRKRSSVMANWS
jgi:hypothetical protein